MFWCWAGPGAWRLHFPSCHPRGWLSGMPPVPSESHLGSSGHAGSGIALMKLRPTRSPSHPLTTVLNPCSEVSLQSRSHLGKRHSETWQPGCRGTRSCFSLWTPAPPGANAFLPPVLGCISPYAAPSEAGTAEGPCLCPTGLWGSCARQLVPSFHISRRNDVCGRSRFLGSTSLSGSLRVSEPS